MSDDEETNLDSVLPHELRARIQNALEIIRRFGGIDGEHHKDWVIDQVTRRLTVADYDDYVARCCDGEDGPNSYSWNVGIAP